MKSKKRILFGILAIFISIFVLQHFIGFFIGNRDGKIANPFLLGIFKLLYISLIAFWMGFFFKGHSSKQVIMSVLLIVFVLTSAVSLDLIAGYIWIPVSGRIQHDYYHHGLKENARAIELWGEKKYTYYTNFLGLKDAKRRTFPLVSNKYRILFIGDSFTEGVGFPYSKTFVGKIAHELASQNIEVLNAGVVSYSPKLYYLKVKYLIDVVGLDIDELIVYIDISDIQDEIEYRTFSPLIKNKPEKSHSPKSFDWYAHSYAAYSIQALSSLEEENILSEKDKTYYQERDKWTSDEKIYQKWGKEGLILAEAWMEKLIAFCRQYNIKTTIAVYPWPEQIRRKETACKQVEIWQTFAQNHHVGFINYFPEFINSSEPAVIIKQYFIDNDVHWNKAGHHRIAQKFLDFYLTLSE